MYINYCKEFSATLNSNCVSLNSFKIGFVSTVAFHIQLFLTKHKQQISQ